ncbi:MAG TPA: YdcF family protein [Rhodanobacteraceae bacterium]|nr:YdcF family protein [Rhodanobacteraceae bacterium]
MNDLLHILGHPLVQSFTVAVIGVVCLLWRRWYAGVPLLATAVAWAWLCMTPAFSMWLRDNLASRYPTQPATAYPDVQAIVVAGGGPLPRPVHAWNADARPALYTPVGFALALYRDGKAPLIVLIGSTGWPEMLAGMLRAQGVPDHAIVLVSGSSSTYEDALLSAPVLRARGVDRILLVTFPEHMPRTVAVFQHQGLAVEPASSIARTPRAARAGWLPQRRALWRSERCLHEYLGLFYYRVRGWAAW